MTETPKEETDALVKLGRGLWNLRQRAGLSRAKLAKLARVSEASVKLIESGRHRPSARTLVRILGAMNLLQAEGMELLRLLDNPNLHHMQIEMSTSPLMQEGEEAGQVVTIRFLLLPPLKQH